MQGGYPLAIKEAANEKVAFCNIILTLGIFLAGALPAVAATRYTCKDLSTLYNGKTYPYAINAAGQVVGYSETSQGPRAFLYSGNVMQSLGTLPAPYNAGSYAYGINAAGQVVGYSTNSSPEVPALFVTPTAAWWTWEPSRLLTIILVKLSASMPAAKWWGIRRACTMFTTVFFTVAAWWTC